METITIHKAKTQLSRLIEKACRGEEIVIARGSKPVVRLVVGWPSLSPDNLGVARPCRVLCDRAGVSCRPTRTAGALAHPNSAFSNDSELHCEGLHAPHDHPTCLVRPSIQ
jgi:antitoxin (DNA-binding transcriptional repressor) of toxin-antitoxin stability system